MGGNARAKAGNQQSNLKVRRPSWDKVYEGYPKTGDGDDMSAYDVFTSILAERDYEDLKDLLVNACATRVSLGLINGNMNVKPGFQITNSSHPNQGHGFQPSAIKLHKWLSTSGVWGDADVIVNGPTDIDTVADKINDGRVKNGVYIILGGFGEGVTGHATLWVGKNRDVIGGHNYVNYGGTVYFWELK